MPRSKDYQKSPSHYNEYQKDWYKSHKPQCRARARERHRERREQAILLYGGKCACCEENRYEFLAIDHIHGGGTQERKKRWPNAQSFYNYISVTYKPEIYRILCHNCNSAMGYYGYCPHQKEKE